MKVRCYPQIAKKDGAIVVDEEIRCLDVMVYESIDVQIARSRVYTCKKCARVTEQCGMDSLQTLECLAQDALYDLLFHTARPAIMHHVCYTARVHEMERDVQFVAVHPGATDPQNIGMLRQGHELCFTPHQS